MKARYDVTQITTTDCERIQLAYTVQLVKKTNVPPARREMPTSVAKRNFILTIFRTIGVYRTNKDDEGLCSLCFPLSHFQILNAD